MTRRLLESLRTGLPTSDDERETFLAAARDLLGEREAVLKTLTPEMSSEEKAVRELLLLDNELRQELTSIQALIKRDIQELSLRRKSNQRYSFSQITDGIYVDKRGV
ncbi:hypothetical protein [Shouchella shacheensis]|uniref:hypothetical protein n=1 Tax=Shouchella shacheensis TaxID=1649580 RepID=UPI00073FDDCD|nr:hypothetical protein [Shouchella shacheensis]